ncbi:MAG: type I-E CRISPR-associated protein Cse1/CasA [Ignavibacteriaceae bacterium]|nr:type I-E CRISPR-associated protein Cse1/CasA [Ignavibacteriaceae bacterium]
MKAFNLADEPWIPVIRSGTTIERIGIRQCLREAHTIKEIYHDSPLVVMSAFRLLLAFVHRIWPLTSAKDWGSFFAKGKFTAEDAEKYINQWHDRFWLLHSEYPFWQSVKVGTKNETISVNKLVIHRAAGNNAVYHDHSNEKTTAPLHASDAALHLITAQCFSPGGGKSPTINFRSSPFSSALVTYLTGENLFQTLMFNYIIQPDFQPDPDDKPVWERNSPVMPEEETTLTGYLDYLTLSSRLIKLYGFDQEGGTFIDNIQFAQGRGTADDLLDPFVAYRLDKKKGYLTVKVYPERQLWRDYNSLTALTLSTDLRPPLNLSQAANLEERGYIPAERIYSILCGGLSTNKAKILLWRSDSLPLPVALLRDQDFINSCADAVSYAETQSKRLFFFTKSVVAGLISYDNLKADPDAVGRLYKSYSMEPLFWSELDIPFKEFVIGCAAGPDAEKAAYDNWTKTCDRALSSCRRKLEDAVIGESRGPKAIAKAYTTSYKEKK